MGNFAIMYCGFSDMLEQSIMCKSYLDKTTNCQVCLYSVFIQGSLEGNTSLFHDFDVSTLLSFTYLHTSHWEH